MDTDARVLSLVHRWHELRRKGGSPSVADLCADCPELCEAVAPLLAVLAAIEDFPTTDQPPETPPAPPALTTPADALPAQAGRFLLRGEIARGGMGAVLRAHDPAIGRDVALKVILPLHTADPSVLRRFLDEARLAGQLQHPGLAPVYDLGRLPDGRPFFAMKLIEGRTLAALLHEQTGPGRDLPRFLRYFEAVCQAVGYAHSKGVIHRDLKPSNVMVGAFGEVQVMDWGLAKVLRHDSEAPIHLEPAAAEGSASQAGSVVGTPGYMAPEQVRSESERIGPCSDVFGLGAILCEILTGAPPFRGKGLMELLTQTAQGDLADAFARLESCGADGELVRLAKGCLAAEPEQRPADGAAVAASVAAYLSGVQERLRQAEIARARAEAERRRRRAQLGLVAALLVLVLVGGGGAWLFQQQRQARELEIAQQRQLADAATAGAMAEARLLLAQAKANPLKEPGRFQEALAVARKAEQLARTGGASDDLRHQATAFLGAVSHEEEAARRDRRLVAEVLEVRGPQEGPKFQRDPEGLMTAQAEPTADQQFASTFRTWGLDVDTVPTAVAVARLRDRPAAVVTEVIAALDEWASERRLQRMPAAKWQPLADLAQALDSPDSRRRELRAILARRNLPRERALAALAVALRPVPMPFDAGLGADRGRLRQLAALTDPATEPVLGLMTLQRALRVAGDEALAEQVLRAALRARPQEVVLHQTLGQLLTEQRPPRWGEAVECYTAARALRPELGDSLAFALVEAGREKDGFALYERLAADNPSNPWLHFRRGAALGNHDRFQEGEAACRAAIRFKPDYPEAHTNLGLNLEAQGRHTEAEAAHREAIRLYPFFPEAHVNLGSALHAQGRFQEAEASCREAVRLKPDLPIAHNNLGVALHGQGQFQAAEAAYREALRLQPDLPVAHNNLGSALRGQGRFQEAEASHREAIRLHPEYARAHYKLGIALAAQGRSKEAEVAFHEALRLKPDDADAQCNFGVFLDERGRFKEAEAAYREALRLKPDNPEARYNLGSLLGKQARFQEAEAPCREAIRLNPNYTGAYVSLGIALHGQGQFQAAEAAYREALRLQPDLPVAHNNLGSALRGQGRFREAEAAYREALRLQANYAEAHYNLSVALGTQDRHKEVEASLREAIRLQPHYPEAHCNLAGTLQDQGRFTEALEAISRGHALGSKVPGWRYPSAQWLRHAERLVELDRQLPAVLRGDAKPATAAEALDFAALCQHRARRLYAAATPLAADAFAAESKLADDLTKQHRYNAACSAALAAAGQAAEAKNLPDKVTVVLRRQSLQWLRADLLRYSELAEHHDPKVQELVRHRLAHWQTDADLASVRAPDALARLPAAERDTWRQLWSEVEALRRRAAGGKE